ncbi:MAG: peptidase S41 [Chlorobi bacterium]|nr:peptidase S41 [Chlorobiota bacterium]
MNKLYLFLMIALFSATSIISAQPLWMRYPAISPDGKTIAFSYKGNIFKVPAEGGTAVPLTVHKAYDFKPVWSPDSKKIAFASNRFGNFDIYVISADGGEVKRLTYYSGNETPNSFTPDGKNILFSASIYDKPSNVQFPSGLLSELYSVPATGGGFLQVLDIPAEQAKYDKDGKRIFYMDRKGYENIWRKHHTSSVTRDIWMYDTETGKYTRLTGFKGEDRDPVPSPDGKTLYYLSEQFGDFNVVKTDVSNPENVVQISKFKKNPVRFLSMAGNGLLCYGYNGEIYTQKPGEEPQKVNVKIQIDLDSKEPEFLTMTSGASEMALSPNGKEVAFIVRGEVFVTSVDYQTTKQITNTPEQERSVSFSSDGRTLVYASERNNSWNIYTTTIQRDEEEYFYSSTILKEESVLETDKETFQPAFSPDGKEIAYLEERTTLKVINLDSKQTRKILDGKYNYSYSDGDQWYRWSPDGKWFLVAFSPNVAFSHDVGLVKADGSGEVKNMTKSGYNDNRPKWAMKGNAMIWFSDREGLRSHGSWGSQRDVFAMFFNEKNYDLFKMSKEEYELYKEKQKKDKKEKKEAKKDKAKKENKTEPVKTDKSKELKIDLENIDDRVARLTINSSSLADAVLSPDGDELYYLAKFEKGYDLWVHKIKENETKLVLKLQGRGGSIEADSAFKNLFVFAGGKITKITLAGMKQKGVQYKAEMFLDRAAEREYMFDHVWRQVLKKFYDPTLHGIDWEYYKENYRRFLPYINNNFDYAEMLSEMLGELNGSHTGSGYRYSDPKGDRTARLGVFWDDSYSGTGLKIAEVIEKSPLVKDGSKIKEGTVIEKVDAVAVNNKSELFRELNHKEGKLTLLSLYNPETGERWEETVKPVSNRKVSEMLYQRWVKRRRAEVDSLSGGKIGYVHVRGMNSESFRVAYSDILGRNYHKEALIVDTRFNGGGWLHDDLATLLSGKRYADFYPHGRYFGSEPLTKWYKPSVVVVSESNYSDAHGFPFTYRALKIGKIVGMPVPGTMTAVWWETLQDPTLYFGIPQIGVKDMNGNYLENQQLEPDYKVAQDPDVVTKNRDQQLEKAVEVLLKEVEE